MTNVPSHRRSGHDCADLASHQKADTATRIAIRQRYESFGANLLVSGGTISCSEPSIVDAVLRMTNQHTQEFRSVLDVGCGANLTYDVELAKHGKSVHGIDFSLSFLRIAGTVQNIKLVHCDATEIPYRDASFDAAICSEMIEHVPDDAKVVGEIARILRPAGLLFVTVPNLWNAHRIIEMVRERDSTIRMMDGHMREYTRRSLCRVLSPHFEVVSQMPVPFGWTGRVGSKIDVLIRLGIFRAFSKSIALVARRARF